MATFELIEPISNAPPPPGPWTPRMQPGVSFSAGAAPPAPVWRANLSADPLAARSELIDAAADLGRQEQALALAPQRLRAVAAGGVSFSSSANPAPEQQLIGLVGELRGQQLAGVSFGSGQGESESAKLAAARAAFEAFAQRVRDSLSNFALVETRVDNATVGRSAVGWGGDMRTLLLPTTQIVHADLHRRNLALAVRSRAALLRTFGIVVRGAALVARMVGSPAGALTTLPAAWKFVDEMLGEFRRDEGRR